MLKNIARKNFCLSCSTLAILLYWGRNLLPLFLPNGEAIALLMEQNLKLRAALLLFSTLGVLFFDRRRTREENRLLGVAQNEAEREQIKALIKFYEHITHLRSAQVFLLVLLAVLLLMLVLFIVGLLQSNLPLFVGLLPPLFALLFLGLYGFRYAQHWGTHHSARMHHAQRLEEALQKRYEK